MKNHITKLFVVLLLLSLSIVAYAQGGVELIVNATSNDTLGEILVAPNGKTLYTFANDTPGVSNCTGGCAENWPPFVVTPGIEPVGGAGVEGVFSTISRDDGTLQVAYNDSPLYTFTGDEQPGDVNGQGVGDVWFVVSATDSGTAADADVAEGTTDTDTTEEADVAEESTDTDTAPEEAAAAQPVTVLTVSENPTFGNILTDANGNTLYIFLNDLPNQSECVGQCVALWPPLLVDAGVEPVADPSVEGTVGTIQRDDGTIQVTFNEQPLYYYTQDAQPGDTNGQGVGDVWFVITFEAPEPPAEPTATPAVAVSTEMLLMGGNADLGSFLTAANGMTLYIFTNDAPGESFCVGQCLELWPAYTVSADTQVVADAGISGTVGTIQRDDGSIQVTYNDLPLYFYTSDQQPGDATGQNVGEVWFVVPLDVIRVAQSPTLGSYVVAAENGMTLYTFANDEPGWSNCVRECAEAWPPLTVDGEGELPLPPGLDGTLVSSLRADGTFQVIYNNMPLYFFSGDTQPGDANGNGAEGLWSIIQFANCSITPLRQFANLRSGPGTNFSSPRTFSSPEQLAVSGQAYGDDGFIWWNLASGEWVRSDVVTEEGNCDTVPFVEGFSSTPPVQQQAAPPPVSDPPPPATTEEPGDD